jgi:DNA-binding MarR family transcriptional regulator
MVAKTPSASQGKTLRSGGIDMGMLPDLIGFNLRCAHLTVFQHFDATVGQENISAGQFGTLLLIEANPDISQSAIAEALRFDRSTLVQIIDRLEGRGLVNRHVAPQDRRSHALRLTDGGAALLGRLKEIALAHEAEVAGNLDAADRAQLIALLKKLYGG